MVFIYTEGRLVPFSAKMQSRSRNKSLVLVGKLVCLLAIVALTAAALHVHISSGPEADRHCPACVAIHSAAPAAAVVLLVVAAPAAPLPPAIAAVHRFADDCSNLFVRPPPSA